MAHLVSHEEPKAQQYRLKVMAELLTQVHIVGVDPEELIEFFATQIQSMLAAPPNISAGETNRVWVMRGFYPGTPVFFKLTLISTPNTDATTGGDNKPSYFAKASPLRVHWTHPQYRKTRYEEHVYLTSDKLNDNMTLRMENTFFGANHEVKPVLEKKMKMPRCMSPKGLKIFRYEKPKKERKPRAKKSS